MIRVMLNNDKTERLNLCMLYSNLSSMKNGMIIRTRMVLEYKHYSL
jgi:hypothetical protein